MSHTVRLAHLYPRRMNIYGDRGNIVVLDRRLAWRGHRLEITELELDDQLEPEFDLYYLGGGQDRDQALVAVDLLATKAEGLRRAADNGAAMLFVCGGYQLAGHEYVALDGTRLRGLGLLDVTTTACEPRLIGDVVLDIAVNDTTAQVVGYENHAGRTILGSAAVGFGEVIEGNGNDDSHEWEGARRGNIIGTYLHGPLLPKNPVLADLVLGWALRHRAGHAVALEPLDDSLEYEARRRATTRANVRR